MYTCSNRFIFIILLLIACNFPFIRCQSPIDGKYRITYPNFSNNTTIYLSSNYGSTWNPTALATGLGRAVMSGNGSYIRIPTLSDVFYTSTDYGVTWNNQSLGPINNCTLSISGDGQYQVCIASTKTSPYYSSQDFGATWQASSTNSTWLNSAISYSGQYQVFITVKTNYVFYSSDYGATFQNIFFSTLWSNVAISGDGQCILVSAYDYIYKSCNGSAYSLAETSSIPSIQLSLSYSGQFQMVASNFIYLSSDYGQTWRASIYAAGVWVDALLSGSGQYITGTVDVDPEYDDDFFNDVVWSSDNFGAYYDRSLDANGLFVITMNQDNTTVPLDAQPTYSPTFKPNAFPTHFPTKAPVPKTLAPTAYPTKLDVHVDDDGNDNDKTLTIIIIVVSVFGGLMFLSCIGFILAFAFGWWYFASRGTTPMPTQASAVHNPVVSPMTSPVVDANSIQVGIPPVNSSANIHV
jgi:hypothetical protein